MDRQDEYAAPRVEDLGDLANLTQATGIVGAEDGGTKLLPFHHVPAPSSPLGP